MSWDIVFEEEFDSVLVMLCCVGLIGDEMVRENVGRYVCGESRGRSGVIQKPRPALKLLIKAKHITNPEVKGFSMVL